MDKELSIECLMQDAKRYRWLRDTNKLRGSWQDDFDYENGNYDEVINDIDVIMLWETPQYAEGIGDGDEFDRKIDLAIKQWEKHNDQ